MSDALPLEILMAEFLPEDRLETMERETENVEILPPVDLLGSIDSPLKENDPNELIEDRFLYRGGVCLLVGPTGVGKSSLLMQLGIYFSIGKPLFGITPGSAYREKGMRILLIQAENDRGDLAEMRDGVLAGCNLSEEEANKARVRIGVCTVNDKTADRFAKTLDGLLCEHAPYDLVIIDPAFAYLGGDSNSQKEVSNFMRNLLNPILQRHNVGLILAHHTNKPLRGKEKDNWAAGDYAYLGAGSAEWINPARAALALRSIGSETVFELRAPKRGKRLGWKDENDQSTVTQFIAHHRQPGVICWRQAEASEVEEMASEDKGGRPRKLHPIEALHCVQAYPGRNQAFYKEELGKVLKCSSTAAQNIIKECVTQGWIRFQETDQGKLYRLTEKGEKAAKKQPSTVDWGDHPPESTKKGFWSDVTNS